MAELLEGLGVAAFRPFWLPLAAWTVVWLLAEALLRRPWHPLVRYRLAQGALASLPLGVAATALAMWWPAAAVAPALLTAELPMLIVGAGSGGVAPGVAWGWAALGVATVAAGAATLLGLLRLGADALALQRLLRRLEPVGPVERDPSTGIRLVTAAGVAAPFTVGLWRPVIVLPAGLSDAERRLALEHERLHVRRRDFAARWAEAATAALFAVHPGVHRLSRRCVLLREMACDAALLEAGVPRSAYARLLVSFVGSPVPATVGMAARRSHVHQRLDAMKLPSLRPRAPWAAALALFAAGLLLLPAARPPEAAPVVFAAADTVHTIVDEPPQLIGGLQGLLDELRFPEAMSEGPAAVVIVQFVVGADGRVGEVRIVGEPPAPYAVEAERVVRAAQFEPGRHGGEAVPVWFSLPVTFIPEGMSHEEGMRQIIEQRRGAMQRDARPREAEEPPAGVRDIVEQPPALIGGLEGFQQRLRYPELARSAGIEGTVILEFVVDVDGRPRMASCAREIGSGTCEAALAALEEVRFEPGRHGGEAVAVRMALPVRFRLPADETDG